MACPTKALHKKGRDMLGLRFTHKFRERSWAIVERCGELISKMANTTLVKGAVAKHQSRRMCDASEAR